MGISVSYRLGAFGIMSAYFPFRHAEDNLPQEWSKDLFNVLEHHPLVFHNLKFDLHSLATIGFSPRGKLFDTLNMAHLVNEEWPSKSLDWLSRKLLGDGKTKDRVQGWTEAFGWASVPPGLMAAYAQQDAELTLRLFETLWPKMREQELHVLWPTERQFAKLLTEIEARGVAVDVDFCAYMQRKGEERMQDLVDELGFNPASPIELGEFLLDTLKLPILKRGKPSKRFPEGRPSFDKKVMEEYEEVYLPALDSPAARLVLEYRGWAKAVSSLYLPLQRMVSPDGRVRCNFKQHGTVTGRLSCSEPNLQQIPKSTDKPWNGQAKKSFTTASGWELYGYDYSQLELRLAAAYGREQWLLDIFADDEKDVFSEWASTVGVERGVIKTYTYATLYGAGLPKVAATLGRPVGEVEETFNRFKESIASIGHVSRRATQRAESRGYVKMWSGRRRHFGFREDCHKAFNSLLQGGGAEVVKRAMIAIDDDPRINKDECRIVLQVHDEIVFEMQEGARQKYEPYIIEHMTNFPDFGVHFKVEGKVWNK
jgi:DNA polymerase-1